MASRNQTSVAQNQNLVLDVYAYSYSGGPLVDADSTPTYVIKDPNGTTMYSGAATRYSVGYYKATYAVPAGAQVSNSWSIVWTIYINGALVSGASESFIVVSAGSVSFDSEIIIDDKWMNQIKKVVTFPFSSKEILLTDEQIKEYCVWPALEMYFNKFPKRYIQELGVSVNSESAIPFPTDTTYGVIDARVVGKGMLLGNAASFWDTAAFTNLMGRTNRGSGMYGSLGYSPNGLKQSVLNQRWEVGSLSNMMTTTIRVEEDERILYVSCSASGKLDVTWALRSDDFDDVKQVYKWDVVSLAQSYYLSAIADSAGMIQNNMLEISINIDGLKAKAQDLLEKVTAKFQAIPDIVVVRQT